MFFDSLLESHRSSLERNKPARPRQNPLIDLKLSTILQPHSSDISEASKAHILLGGSCEFLGLRGKRGGTEVRAVMALARIVPGIQTLSLLAWFCSCLGLCTHITSPSCGPVRSAPGRMKDGKAVGWAHSDGCLDLLRPFSGSGLLRLRGAGRAWIKKTIKQVRKKEKQRKKRNIDNTNLRSTVWFIATPPSLS